MLHIDALSSFFSPLQACVNEDEPEDGSALHGTKGAAGNNPLGPGSLAEEKQDGELHSIFRSLSSFQMQ